MGSQYNNELSPEIYAVLACHAVETMPDDFLVPASLAAS